MRSRSFVSIASTVGWIITLAILMHGQTLSVPSAISDGKAVAAFFGAWRVEVTSPVSSPGSATIIIPSRSVTLSDGREILPFQPNVPLLINDGPRTETIVPSAVNCTGNSGPCSMTATFQSAHPGNYWIMSANGGLNEAIATVAHTGGVVVLTPDWTGNSAELLKTTLPTNVLIEDLRMGTVTWYSADASMHQPAIVFQLSPSATTTSSLSVSGGIQSQSVQGVLNVAEFNFAPVTPTSPSAIVPGVNTVSVAPCPPGTAGSNLNHHLLLAATGTPEIVTIAGGTCTPNAASGTLVFTAAYSHGSGYTLQSATGGIEEAWDALPQSGGTLYFPAGTYPLYTCVNLSGKSVTWKGDGIGKSLIDASHLSSSCSPALSLSGTMTLLGATTTAPVHKGDTSIQITSNAGISPSDWLILQATQTMAQYPGVVSLVNNSATVTGTNTHFTSDLQVGSVLKFGDGGTNVGAKGRYTVTQISDDTHLSITPAFYGYTTGPAGTAYYDADDYWNTSRDYYLKGEWISVAAIDGTTLTLGQPAQDDYPSGMILYRLDPVSLSLTDFELECNGNIEGLDISSALHPTVSNVKTSGCREAGSRIRRSVDAYVHRYLNEDTYYAGTGTSYGLDFSSVQNAFVDDSQFLSGRHGVTVGNESSAPSAISRNVIIRDNLAVTEYAQAMDCHGSADDVQFVGNVVIGGIDLECGDATVRGNRIWANLGSGAAILGGSDTTNLNLNINGNYIYSGAGSQSSGAVIQYSGIQSDQPDGDFTLEDNDIETGASTTGPLIDIDAIGGESEAQLLLRGNRLEYNGPGGTTANNGQILLRHQDGLFRRVVVDNNHGDGVGITIQGRVGELLATKNILMGSHGSGLSLLTSATGGGLEGTGMVDDNYIARANSAGISIQGEPNTTTTLMAFRNRSVDNNQCSCQGSSSQWAGLSIENIASAHVRDNDFGDDQTIHTQKYGFYIDSSVGSIMEGNNITDGNLSPSLDAAVHVTDTVSNAGKVHIQWGSASPSSGTGVQGDIVWNATPQAGAALGWINTGGTPGQWSPFGPISTKSGEMDLSVNTVAANGITLGTDAPMTSNPRSAWNVFLSGLLNTNWIAGTLTPDRPIVVTRITASAKTPPAGCSTSPIIELDQGAQIATLAVTGAVTDSGSLSLAMNAAQPIQIQVEQSAVGCTTTPSDINVTVEYRMQ